VAALERGEPDELYRMACVIMDYCRGSAGLANACLRAASGGRTDWYQLERAAGFDRPAPVSDIMCPEFIGQALAGRPYEARQDMYRDPLAEIAFAAQGFPNVLAVSWTSARGARHLRVYPRVRRSIMAYSAIGRDAAIAVADILLFALRSGCPRWVEGRYEPMSYGQPYRRGAELRLEWCPIPGPGQLPPFDMPADRGRVLAWTLENISPAWGL
jgi:hypothetical protein